MSNNRLFLLLAFVIVVALLFLNCAPGNERWDQDISPGHKAGFWAGLWHGLIVIITFIVSLFTKEVGIYEVNNVGWPYNLGFLIGLCFSFLAPWRMKPWKWRKKLHS
jgi:hypothetical protein